MTLGGENSHYPDCEGVRVPGHRVRIKWDDRYGYSPRIEIPKQKVEDLRRRIKNLTTRSTLTWSLERLLGRLIRYYAAGATTTGFAPGRSLFSPALTGTWGTGSGGG